MHLKYLKLQGWGSLNSRFRNPSGGFAVGGLLLSGSEARDLGLSQGNRGTEGERERERKQRERERERERQAGGERERNKDRATDRLSNDRQIASP